MERSEKLLLRSSPSEDTTPEMGLVLGHALALDCKKVVIGMDLMKSSPMMKNALVSGLISSGADVIDVGIVSGPALALAAKMGDCGVYITEFRQLDLVSGFLLFNNDGCLFSKEQIRHLNRIFEGTYKMPDYKALGSVREYYQSTNDYNSKALSLIKEKAAGSIILNCNCGTASDSAPQILNIIGADVISINGQKDRNFISDSLSTKEADTRHMKALVEANAGSTGISINRIGTLLRVFDESGTAMTDEQVLAILILYMKPAKVVVPMDMTAFIEDAFHGNIDVEISSPNPDPDAERTEFIYCRPELGSVRKAMLEHSADIGYYKGGFIFSQISLSPDAIFASAQLALFSGSNNVKSVVESFPEYYSEKKSYKISCNHDDFIRMMDANLPEVSPTDITEDGCWRVQMTGGWFYVSFNKDSEDTIDVIAESNDRVYLVSLVEVIDGLMESCESGQ